MIVARSESRPRFESFFFKFFTCAACETPVERGNEESHELMTPVLEDGGEVKVPAGRHHFHLGCLTKLELERKRLLQ